MSLTDKQAAFVREYTVDWNATQAAIRAGYSERTAAAIGSENLSKPEISAAIKARVSELAMSADEALVRLGAMARGTVAPFHRLTADGDIIVDLSTKEAQDHLHLLTELEVSTRKREHEDGSVTMHQSAKVKLHDAKDALKQILRAHGLDRTGVDLRTPEGIEIAVTRKVVSAKNRIAEYVDASANGANGNGKP